MASTLDVKNLKVPELRLELTNRGLDAKGNKPDLIVRLTAAIESEKSTTTPTTQVTSQLLSTTPAQTVTISQQPIVTPSVITSSPPTSTLSTNQQAQTTTATNAQNKPGQVSENGGKEIEGEEEGEEQTVDFSEMTDAERKKARAERFGIPLKQTDDEKKKDRASRFGLTHSGGGLSKSTEGKEDLLSQDKIDARKKRFGVVSSPAGAKKEEESTSVKGASSGKAQRLGLPVKGAGAASAEDEARKKARKERFESPAAGGSATTKISEDEERKRKRLERFAPASTADSKRLRVDKPLVQQTNA